MEEKEINVMETIDNSNRYDIEITTLDTSKKRHSPIEKAKYIMEVAEKIDNVKGILKLDILQAVNDITATASLSNTKEMQKLSNKVSERIATLLDKILG